MAKKKLGGLPVTAPSQAPSAPAETVKAATLTSENPVPLLRNEFQLSFTSPQARSEDYSALIQETHNAVTPIEYEVWPLPQTTSSPIEPMITPSIVEPEKEKLSKRSRLEFFYFSSEDASQNIQFPGSPKRISDSLPQAKKESPLFSMAMNSSAPSFSPAALLPDLYSEYKTWEPPNNAIPPLITSENAFVELQLHTGSYVEKLPLENEGIEKEPIHSLELDYVPSFKEKIGEGTFSVVYKDIYKNQDVVIKIPIPGFDPAISHLRQEHLMHFRLQQIQQQYSYCPNIVSMYAFDSTHTWLILERMEKGSLDNLLSIKPPPVLSIDLPNQLTKDILQGIAFLHEHHIVHRDLKPANILLTHQYRAKLADFGIAIEITDSSDSRPRGEICWMPPEVLLAFLCQIFFKPSPNNDIYNTGLILLMLTCWRSEPYQITRNLKRSPKIILDYISIENIRTGKRDDIPNTTPFWLKTVVCQSLDKNPQNRPSARQLLQTIINHNSEDTSIAPPPREQATASPGM